MYNDEKSKVLCFIRAHRKAIAAGAAALASYVSIHVFAHGLDPVAAGTILAVVPLLIVHAVPNTDCV